MPQTRSSPRRLAPLPGPPVTAIVPLAELSVEVASRLLVDSRGAASPDRRPLHVRAHEVLAELDVRVYGLVPGAPLRLAEKASLAMSRLDAHPASRPMPPGERIAAGLRQAIGLLPSDPAPALVVSRRS